MRGKVPRSKAITPIARKFGVAVLCAKHWTIDQASRRGGCLYNIRVYSCSPVLPWPWRRQIRLPRRRLVRRRVVSTKRPLRFSSEHDRTKQNSFRIIRNSTNDARPSRAQRIRFNASTNHERNQLDGELRKL